MSIVCLGAWKKFKYVGRNALRHKPFVLLLKMPNYRRTYIDGGCWFFTVNLQSRNSSLLVDEIVKFRQAYSETQNRHPFQTNAIVILPNHIHVIWTLPPNDTDYSMRWRRIKSVFSKSLPKKEVRSDVQIKRGERGIWQRRFWEHAICDENDFERHVHYCYGNPVKHGLVENIADWPYSSYHRDVAAGKYPSSVAPKYDQNFDFGE